MSVGPVKKVGFIGLGRMGLPIAHNILQKGFDLTVYNRTAEKMQPLVNEGACQAASPKEVAEQSEVIFTCLLDDQSMLEVVAGRSGLLEGMRPGSIHVGTATVSPTITTRLAEMHQEAGTFYIAAPLFGRPDSAEAGTLLTYAAGDKEAFETALPVIEAYTQSQIYLGDDHKVVNSVKLTMNFMLVSLIELFSEVYTFTEKSDVDPELTNNLILTVLSHPVMKEYARRIRTRDYSTAFSLKTGFKDVELMLEASSSVRAPLNIASLVHAKFLTALAKGMQDQDWSAIADITRINAGLIS